MPKPEQTNVINATCTACGQHIEGKLPAVSKAYLCPHCNKPNETVHSETVHELSVYGRFSDTSRIRTLKPTKPLSKDMKVTCTNQKCNHSFEVHQVYEGQIRICPKCGKKITFKRVCQICFACQGRIEAIVPEYVRCIQCPRCGSYEPI